jgi:hypothetical protein
VITEVWLDESIDEEVWAIDAFDGPFSMFIEAAPDLDPSEWAVAWASVKGPDWVDAVFDLENIDVGLKYIDPRFTEDLMNAPVLRWWWK